MDKGYKLYNAVKAGESEKVRALIDDGADVNYVFQPEEYGNTPLHMAAYFAMNNIMKLLIDNGANVNSYSLEGKTPLDYAVERHNRAETVSLLLRNGAINGTAPIPDFASVGEVFLTRDNQYFLIMEDGKTKEYQKNELQDLLERRKTLSCIGKEVEISFGNDEQRKTSVYYAFSLPKINVVTEAKGIAEEIDTIEHPGFKLALVTDEIAVYINPGDDVLTIDLASKTIMDEIVGVKKYHETMEKIINKEKEYEYGEKLVSYCRKNHAFEHRQHDIDEIGQTIPAVNFQHRRRGR